MKKVIFLFVFLLLNIFVASDGQDQGNLNQNAIKHCNQSKTAENNTICQTCEDGYFLFNNSTACLSCNDSEYGQIGCIGKCYTFNNSEIPGIACEKDGCKEGYTYSNGTCIFKDNDDDNEGDIMQGKNETNITERYTDDIINSTNDIKPGINETEVDDTDYDISNFNRTENGTSEFSPGMNETEIDDTDYDISNFNRTENGTSSQGMNETEVDDTDYDISNYNETERDTDAVSPSLIGCLYNVFNEELNILECLECEDGFILLINDSTCKNISEIDISNKCSKIENIGSVEEPIYSCYQCNYNYTLVINVDGIKYCFLKDNNFSYCSERKMDENGNIDCISCVENANFNNYNICECNDDSFGTNNKCHKCDDYIFGNPGCIASKGCNYSNDESICNECKEGYYKNYFGQCNRCIFNSGNCDKCHYDGDITCDNCINIFSLNKEEGTCYLNDCEEYPEIAPGCIICKDHLNEYKPYNKCQTCKYGYFKTKNESCVYCRSEKYGGPSCYECGYEKDKYGNETNNIICKDCNLNYEYYDEYYYYYIKNSVNFALSSKGKCYNCKYNLSESCTKCGFINDTNNNEKLVCTMFDNGYYLDSEGKYISYIDKIIRIPNCYRHRFNINNYFFYYYINNNKSYVETYEYEYYTNKINELLKNINSSINTSCEECQEGHFFNSHNECEIFTVEKCTGDFIYKNIDENLYICDDLCYKNEYPYITIELSNYSSGNNTYIIHGNITLDVILSMYDVDKFNNQIKNVILNSLLCYNISNEEMKYKFEGCREVFYNNKTKKYQCIECNNDYFFDNINHICHRIDYRNKISIDCDLENIGNQSFPIYSCKSCYYYQILVTLENGVKVCVYDYSIENCNTINATSEYVNLNYNYDSCILNVSHDNSILNLKSDDNKNFSEFEKEENIPINENGTCKNSFFTPGNRKCYKCDNKKIGMYGCKDNCTFLLNISDILCEGGCKNGYIESSKGICETCDSINSGCFQCHYNETYPNDYFGIKTARRFQCDYCEKGYILSRTGKCFDCYGLGKCENCIESEITGNFKCIECSKYYYLNENGKCERCVVDKEILNNKCIECDDISQGGIKNCYFCKKNEEENGLICKQCKEGYILYNNSCYERKKFDKNSDYDSCLEIRYENNKYICIKCKPQYSLLKANNESKCTYTPTLFDPNYYLYYKYNYYNTFGKYAYNDYMAFEDNDYLYRHNYFLPCKESINLGTNENPLYSCSKCFDIFEEIDYDYYYFKDYYIDEQSYYDNYEFSIYYEHNKSMLKEILENPDNYFDKGYFSKNTMEIPSYYRNIPLKIIDEQLKISYCMEANEDMKYCLEANYSINDGTEKYNCIKCMKGYKLEYNKKLDINSCFYDDICLVKYCNICVKGNNYICSKCISLNHEVNNITGSCVKKTEYKPSIIWKDIYGYNIDGQKEINGRIIKGPSFILRGITSSQISQRYAFLIYQIYQLKNSSELLNISTICEIDEEIEETNNDINIIDFICIGNNTIDENYELIQIKGDNLNNISLYNIYKNIYNYTYVNLPTIFIIENDDVNNIIYHNNIIHFTISGKLNNQINISKLNNISIDIKKIDIKVFCDFYSDKDLNANLSCNLKIDDYIEAINLTFENNEINIGENILFINSLNKINFFYYNNNDETNIVYDSTVMNATGNETEIISSDILETEYTDYNTQDSNETEIDSNYNSITEVTDDYTDYDMTDSSTYIDNPILIGCLISVFNEKLNRRECVECVYGFILLINDSTCKNSSEIELSTECSKRKTSTH